MKNFIFVLLVVVAGLTGLGVYRGWFAVNQHKIAQDEAAAKTELHDLEQTVKDKTSGLKSPSKDRK